mmetsp:Transcript_8353/g.18330  ORF Transcript_8353/g.18330 Transcript_8353/m.18330 type:complete len:262 (-) Transcript_8353:627-1412(-)
MAARCSGEFPFADITLIFGAVSFSFGTQSVIPMLVRDMKHPDAFPFVANVAYAGMVVLYGLVGVAGSAAFARDLLQYDMFQLVAGTSRVHTVVGYLFVACLTTTAACQYVVTFMTIAASLDCWFQLDKVASRWTASGEPATPPEPSPTPESGGLCLGGQFTPSYKSALLRAGLVAATMLIAVLIDSAELIVTTLGSFAYINSLIFPALFKLQMAALARGWLPRETAARLEVAASVVLIGVAVLIMVEGGLSMQSVWSRGSV